MRINEIISQQTFRPLPLQGKDCWSLEEKGWEGLGVRERNLDKMGERLEMEPGNDISLLKIR